MYGIIRLKKFKRSAVYCISMERNRTSNDKREYAYSDIDKEQTALNHHYIKTENWNKKISNKLAETGLKERADSVVMVGAVITASEEFFTKNKYYREKPEGKDDRKPREKQKWIRDQKTADFFTDSLKLFVKECCDGDWSRVISAAIDYDEKTPHLQIYIIPLKEKENKRGEKKMHLTAKEIVGNRNDLRRLQDTFHEKIFAPRGMERGEKVQWFDPENPGQEREPKRYHQETIDYKKRMVSELDKQLASVDHLCARGIELAKKSFSELEKASYLADTFLREVNGSMIKDLALEFVETAKKEIDGVPFLKDYFYNTFVPMKLNDNPCYVEFQNICESVGREIDDYVEEIDEYGIER